MIKGITGPVNRDGLSQSQGQWIVAGIEFTRGVSEEFLQPLLEIFELGEFSGDELCKLFCVPQSWIGKF